VSEIMLLGVLRAPHDPANFLAMVQLIARAREAADRIEELERALRELWRASKARLEPEVDIPALTIMGNYERLHKAQEQARAVLEKKS
jgi:hypothetical protein